MATVRNHWANDPEARDAVRAAISSTKSNASKISAYSTEWLHEQYVYRQRTARDIGEEVGCSTSAVLNALRRRGIAVRPKAQAMRLAKSGVDLDEDEVVRLYTSGVSTGDIARLLRSSKATIIGVLKRHDVPRRSKSEAAKNCRPVTRRTVPRARDLRGVVDRCVICGAVDRLEMHHVNADPSDNSRGNLVAFCWGHHLMVEYFVNAALSGIRARERVGA